MQQLILGTGTAIWWLTALKLLVATLAGKWKKIAAPL